jgi:hypothetical protein
VRILDGPDQIDRHRRSYNRQRLVHQQACWATSARRLNYAREHWIKLDENPPVGPILCGEKGASEAHYALDNLPNKELAAEYLTVLPDEKLIAQELERTRRELEDRVFAGARPCR